LSHDFRRFAGLGDFYFADSAKWRMAAKMESKDQTSEARFAEYVGSGGDFGAVSRSLGNKIS
jgi:hypothetical protein